MMSMENKAFDSSVEGAEKNLDPTLDVTVVDQQGPLSDYDLANDPHRGLRMRHVQLLAISGAVGAGLFVSIGGPLTSAGPLGLVLGVIIWSFVIWCGSNCLVEMTTLLPIDGGFITFIGRFLDETVSRAIGWNYCVAQASLVCFELTALNVLVAYWDPTLHPAILISVGIASYAAFQLWSVRIFGEVEFWLSITKVLLMIGLALYTFISMLGGNPLKDRYGFRFWKNPGPMVGDTPALRMKGVFDALIWCCFAVGGPDWISLVAGEVKSPRKIMPRAFSSTIYRILFFYVLGAFCVGINTASDDKNLLGAIAAGAPGAAKSPYIISMNRLNIPVLPSLINALIFVSVFSTGNAAVFATSRAIHALALRGGAPAILKRQNKKGVPYVAVIVVLLYSCISYLSVSQGSVIVLTWFTSIVGGANLVNWVAISVTYLRFRAGLKAQGLLNTGFLPVKGYWQPWSGYWVLFWAPVVFICSGYGLMLPGNFKAPDFIFTYGAFIIFIGLYVFMKIFEVFVQKKPFIVAIPAKDIDLHSDLPYIEALTAASDAQRASHKKSAGKKISDFLF